MNVFDRIRSFIVEHFPNEGDNERLFTLCLDAYNHAVREISIHFFGVNEKKVPGARIGGTRDQIKKNNEQLQIIEQYFTGIDSVEGIQINFKDANGKRHRAYLRNNVLNRGFFEALFLKKGKLPDWSDENWVKALDEFRSSKKPINPFPRPLDLPPVNEYLRPTLEGSIPLYWYLVDKKYFSKEQAQDWIIKMISDTMRESTLSDVQKKILSDTDPNTIKQAFKDITKGKTPTPN